MIRDLVGDCPNRRGGTRVCERGVYLVCGEGIVDVVFLEGFFGREGQAGPDYGVGFDGRDVECRLIRVDIICIVCVRDVAAGEVVEVSSLSASMSVSECLPRSSHPHFPFLIHLGRLT